MNTTTNAAATSAARHLQAVPTSRPGGIDRDAALRQVRRARTQLEGRGARSGRGRDGRFAHLKRMHD